MGDEKEDLGNDVQKDMPLVSEVMPQTINVLPILARPIFPYITFPITFTGKLATQAVSDAIENNKGYMGVVLVKKPNKKDYFQSELYKVGTIVRIHKTIESDEHSIKLIVQGLQRFIFINTIETEPFLKWEIKTHDETGIKVNDELKPYILSMMNSIKELLKMNPIIQEQIKLLLAQHSYEHPQIMVDLISSLLSVESTKLQELLETFNFQKRIEKLLVYLEEEIELFKIQEKIQNEIKEKVDKHQKDFFLREQLKAIKKELGIEKDGKSTELEKFEKRLEKLTLSVEARNVINEELDKMRILEPHSPEYQITRNYLNELTSLPWGISKQKRLSIAKARRILNEQHYGLMDVKSRILEFISTIIKRGKSSGSIICLVGPPGVGKTSVGKSIADALGREFFRFSIGGMRDEAEIKGHRRTYIGAMPGKIMQALKRTGAEDSVIMLDEIDKIGSSYHGDPASSLLEVLDPEQNRDFLDHYLDVRFDLSKILFITTANQLDTIPPALLDRMEVIKLSGYILEEKLMIAKKFLVKKQMKEHGLNKNEVEITDTALRTIIDDYAREAGVRGLENHIKKIMRQVTLKIAEKGDGKYQISTKNLVKYLGQPLFNTENLYEKSIPGVVLGLAWTAMGGSTLYIEASAVPSKS
ncbi:MAG: endopeptidase La, partial [Oligoflexales bacterium]|nr:endopeptidase La [Oligoflexales bacterium]